MLFFVNISDVKTTNTIDFWGDLQSIIQNVCKQFDQLWRVRRRTIDTLFLVLFIFKLVMSKNKQGYNTTLCALWDAAPQDTGHDLPKTTPIAASSVSGEFRAPPPYVR